MIESSGWVWRKEYILGIAPLKAPLTAEDWIGESERSEVKEIDEGRGFEPVKLLEEFMRSRNEVSDGECTVVGTVRTGRRRSAQSVCMVTPQAANRKPDILLQLMMMKLRKADGTLM